MNSSPVDVSTGGPPIRLNAAKIPGCSKAHVCNDLQYGGRQLGKGTRDANSAQTYDLYLPGNVGEIDRKPRIHSSGAGLDEGLVQELVWATLRPWLYGNLRKYLKVNKAE